MGLPPPANLTWVPVVPDGFATKHLSWKRWLFLQCHVGILGAHRNASKTKNAHDTLKGFQRFLGPQRKAKHVYRDGSKEFENAPDEMEMSLTPQHHTDRRPMELQNERYGELKKEIPAP